MIIDTTCIPNYLEASVLRLVCHLAEVQQCVVGDVATLCGMRFATATGIVIRAEGKGLVSRHPCPRDARKCLLRLTEKGHSLVESLRPSTAQLLNP